MTYEMSVQVYIRPQIVSGAVGTLELRETQVIDLNTLSDAAEVLVKLHEFFETLKTKAVKR